MKLKYPRVKIIILIAAALLFSSTCSAAKLKLDSVISQLSDYEFGDSSAWRPKLLEAIHELENDPELRAPVVKALMEFMSSDASFEAKRELVPLTQALVGRESVDKLKMLSRDPENSPLAMDILLGAGLISSDECIDLYSQVPIEQKTRLILRLGELGGPGILEFLVSIAESSDPSLQGPAISAIGNLGTRQSAAALLEMDYPEIASSREQALLVCATKLIRNDDLITAETIYQSLRNSENSHVRLNALTGLFRLSDNRREWLIQTLKDTEPEIRTGLIRLLYELPDPQGIGAELLEIRGLSTSDVHSILMILAQLGDPSVLPKARQWLLDPTYPDRRMTGINVLSMAGTENDVPALISLAASGSKDEQRAARQALSMMKGEAVDTALIGSLSTGSISEKEEVIDALAARDSVSAADALLKLSKKAGSDLQKDALKAFSLVAPPELFPDLINLRLICTDSAFASALDQALYRMLLRQPDPSEQIRQLRGAIESSSSDGIKESFESMIQRLSKSQS